MECSALMLLSIFLLFATLLSLCVVVTAFIACIAMICSVGGVSSGRFPSLVRYHSLMNCVALCWFFSRSVSGAAACSLASSIM